MNDLLLGHDVSNGGELRIPYSAFATHLHLIGGTGKGKTTAIHTMLQPLLLDMIEPACFFIIDRLGNFSQELLLWMASPEFCTDHVRDRLVFIQPSREESVLTFNPLLYDTQASGYYRVERATEIMLRAWESVNIEAMPRLARWVFNAFWAAAQLGLTISDCVHFLMPGSKYHRILLSLLPEQLQAEWQEITSSTRSQEAIKILDSSRNRLKPYFESVILRRMFGSTVSRFDVLRFMRERKIVILDLSPRNRLSTQVANTIGSLALNEILAVARSLPRHQRYPTYLFLDEFQNFVGPDIESALPEVRQLGLRLILSHQSFSQLKQGDYDLQNMIFQAQTRMIFGVQGEDADLLANELASIGFDPRKIKDEIYTRRQLQKGHKIINLHSWSDSEGQSSAWNQTYGNSWSQQQSRSQKMAQAYYDEPTETKGQGRSHSQSRGQGNSSSMSSSHGRHEAIVPEHEEFLEVSKRTYEAFDEQRSVWASRVRKLATGEALIRLVNDPLVHQVMVKRLAVGYLKYDIECLAQQYPIALENVDRLIERNFASELFQSADQIDQEIDRRIQSIVAPPILVRSAKPKQIGESTESLHAPPSNPDGDVEFM